MASNNPGILFSWKDYVHARCGVMSRSNGDLIPFYELQNHDRRDFNVSWYPKQVEEGVAMMASKAINKG